MISKEVISKTQKKLIKINMLVVFGFLILLCIFTYIYFGYTNDNNINKEMHGELNSVVNQLEKLDSRYGLLYGLDREGIKLQNPKDMVYIYMDDNLLNRNLEKMSQILKTMKMEFIRTQQKKDMK